jgi:hypothetical protein
MSVHAVIYRHGGEYHGYVLPDDVVHCPRNHGPLWRIATRTAWSPHYGCPCCDAVYAQIGGGLVLCESPWHCVFVPWRPMGETRVRLPRVLAGPFSRGLL